jgi:hypothetical protein
MTPFAIEQDSLGLELPHIADDARKAFGPIGTGARIDAHAVADLADHQAVPVVFDFVDPTGADGHALGRVR